MPASNLGLVQKRKMPVPAPASVLLFSPFLGHCSFNGLTGGIEDKQGDWQLRSTRQASLPDIENKAG
jgi:hypothetical protein